MRTNLLVEFIALALLLILSSTVVADRGLIRGAVLGEIYIHGVGGTYPDWEDWLYRSTDSGQTVYLQNDTVLIGGCGLAEGVDVGELYKTSPSGRLSHSDTYGVDFVLKKALGSDLAAIASGYVSGEVYAYIHLTTKYSSDYGETFVDKGTCPGWVSCMSVGHSPGEVYCGCNSGEVYHSTNYGETYDLVSDLANSIDFRCTSRGSEAGEIYLLGDNMKLYYSPNHGDTLYEQHHFDTDYITGIAGGLSPGEVYVLESEHYFMGGGDLYIHRSTDYGETFTKYHVYSAQEDIIPPQAIADLTCVPSDSSIFLEWSPVTTDIWGRYEMVDHHVVYRNIAPDFVPSEEDSIGFSTTYSYIDSCARWATPTYYYVVKVVDDSGNKSGVSNRVGKLNKELINE